MGHLPRNNTTKVKSQNENLIFTPDNDKYSLKMIGVESMARYVSPVNPAIFAHLTFVLMAIGLFFTAWFFVYEVTSTKFTRDPKKELLIKFVASVFMGLGSHFLILWVGIYV